jgi:hypothetical protein
MNKCINCKYVDLTSKDYPCYVCEDNDRFESAETKITNYDKIVESVESLAEFVYKVRFNCALSDYGCDYCLLKELGDCNKTNIKEWLQKECDNG